jgi:5S rRNA maturation endonuclease (ribonuclease M5)
VSGSDSEWGTLVRADSDLADVWDGFARLPDHGENEALDAFCERKHISIPSLVRLGARLADPGVLTFAYDHGIKFRDIVTGRRWNYIGSEFTRMKVVPAQTDGATQCIVAEGETDAARLTELYPQADVAVMPAGAETFTEDFATQLKGYGLVLVGLDADAAGERGAQKIITSLPQAMRFAPPANDWCEAGEVPPLPVALDRPAEAQVMVPAGAMLLVRAGPAPHRGPARTPRPAEVLQELYGARHAGRAVAGAGLGVLRADRGELPGGGHAIRDPMALLQGAGAAAA